MSLIFMLIVLENQLKMSWNVLESPGIWKNFLSGHHEEVSDETDFLHVHKHESLLQIDTMTLIAIVKHSQSSQNSKVTMSLQYIKKEVRKGVHF